MKDRSPQVMQVVREVRASIGEIRPELPEEFRPAHLSVALVDAVFNPRLRYYRQVVPIIERYCRYFGLERLRDSDRIPAREKQETLAELVRHYEDLGLRRMREEVFRANYCSPGKTPARKSDNVLYWAKSLRGIGIETLQDVANYPAKEVKGTIQGVRGIGERTVHMLLMCCGDDECVKGDVHVCRFVRRALGATKIEPEQAEWLVACAAREIGVPPRALDVRIWEHGAKLHGVDFRGRAPRIRAPFRPMQGVRDV